MPLMFWTKSRQIAIPEFDDDRQRIRHDWRTTRGGDAVGDRDIHTGSGTRQAEDARDRRIDKTIPHGPALPQFRLQPQVQDAAGVEHLLEGEGHATADDEAVNFGEEIVNQLDLIGDLRSAEDSQEWSLRIFQRLREVL